MVIRFLMRVILAAFYLLAGIVHIRAPGGFLKIVPPFVPWPETVVFLTGLCEIAGAVGLFIPALRKAAGWGLVAYAVCVFPANIYQAIYMIPVPPLPNSWWYHGPRMVLQPIIIWWTLYASHITSWPFQRRSLKKQNP